MIVVDVFGITAQIEDGLPFIEFNGTFEIDARVTFYVNKEVMGQLRGEFIIKSDKSLSFDDAAEAIKEMFRRSTE